VPREVVLEHLEHIFDLFDSARVVRDGRGGGLGRAVRVALALCWSGLCTGQVGVRCLDVAGKGAGELGVLAACLQDAGIDLLMLVQQAL
jgi:hypothetical protein